MKREGWHFCHPSQPCLPSERRTCDSSTARSLARPEPLLEPLLELDPDSARRRRNAVVRARLRGCVQIEDLRVPELAGEVGTDYRGFPLARLRPIGNAPIEVVVAGQIAVRVGN